MKFLKMDLNELVQNYVISNRNATAFIYLTDLLIKFARSSLLVLYLFCFSLHVRVLIYALRTLSIKDFILFTLPNLVSFWIVAFTCFQALNCFLVIFALTCSFIQQNLKSSTKFSMFHQLNKTQLNRIANLNLKCLNDVIKIFEPSQKHTDLTLSTLYSMVGSIAFTFPYVRF